MEKLEIRFTRDQLDAVLDALAAAAGDRPGDRLVPEWEQLGSWLSHRYTRRWGLPRRAAAALAELRGAGG